MSKKPFQLNLWPDSSWPTAEERDIATPWIKESRKKLEKQNDNELTTKRTS